MSVPNSLASDRVFDALLEAVLAGRFAVGERLPRQRDLAADLGVTLSTLREALKRLEQMGVLDVRHGDATRVRDWRAHGGLDVLAHVLLRGGTVDRAVLGDVFVARTAVLGELADLAARADDPAGADRLAALAARFATVAAEGDADAAAHVDLAFFTELADVAGNLVFRLVLNTIRDLYLAHLDVLTVTADPSPLAPAYAEIAAAVAAGDPDRARAAARGLATVQAAVVTTDHPDADG